MKKDKAKPAPAPITKRGHNPAVTAANKQRNIEREKRRQMKAALKRAIRAAKYNPIPIEQQKPINPLLLSQRLKAQQIHREVKQKVNRVNYARLAKNLFCLEERAHVHTA